LYVCCKYVETSGANRNLSPLVARRNPSMSSWLRVPSISTVAAILDTKKYAGTGAAYIDPFCGPGCSLIRDTTRFIDGSPVAAFKRALESPGRFTSINISDGDDDLLDAATKRLTAVDAPVRPFAGPASVAMPKIVQSLDRHGLHLAFLDPYNLGTLSFDLFVELAKLKRIDVIAHVSLHDLQRNAGRYTSEAHDEFDKCAFPSHLGQAMTGFQIS
jgi:three-Cys-motif partner protein